MAQTPQIFDRAALARVRARAERSIEEAFLVREAAEGLAARLTPINRTFVRAADIDGRNVARDVLSPFASTWTEAHLSQEEVLQSAGDQFELATSVLSLHFANDLPGALIQIRRFLCPDGVFAAALLGGETLRELRHAFALAEIELHGGTSPRVVPLADVRDLGLLLQRAGFALPVADVERTTVFYRSLSKLAHDLRLNGQTNVLRERSKRVMSRALFQSVEDHYRQGHSDSSGRLRATFDIVYLIGWSPSQSQPKPLKPGSAKVSLASALKLSGPKL